MFWLHSDIFDISLKFPPNFLGVHRLTNHNSTHANNVTHACHGRRGMCSAFISSLTARAEIPYCVISITVSIDFMQANFCRVRALAEALPAQYVKERFAVQGGICIW